MKKYSIVIIVAMHIPVFLFSQGQFLDKGEDGITVGITSLFNQVYGSIAEIAMYSYAGTLDFSISSGINTYGNENKGRIFSPAISYYLLRGEKSRTFIALHASYSSESLSLPSSDNEATGYTYGVIIGHLVKSSREIALRPSVGIFYQNSSNKKTERARGPWFPTAVVEESQQTSFIGQVDFSFFFPIKDRNALILDCAYAFAAPQYGQVVSMYGISLSYIFSFGK